MLPRSAGKRWTKSGSSSSGSDGGKKKRKKHKKDKGKEKKNSKKDKKKHKGKKGKKDKEGKKEKKKDKETKKKEAAGAVTSRWGKYGIIKETDMWTKRPEFAAWLLEVKSINIETLPSGEEKAYFKDYMEDYNTATMPSRKYYNMEKWDQEVRYKEMLKGKKALATGKPGVVRTEFNDEAERRAEIQRLRDQRRREEERQLMAGMDRDKIAEMKAQQQLKDDMQYHYKTGNLEAAMTIQKRLAPDEPGAKIYTHNK
eukprot:jgi/Mesvir1/2418/Mv22154-RA.2